MIPETPLFYSVLWETAKSGVLSTKFMGWVEGVLKPLDHLNKRLHLIFKINEWEGMPDSKLFNIIFDGVEDLQDDNNIANVIENELIPTLSYGKKWDTFITEFFNKERFSLKSDTNYQLFLKIYYSLEKKLKDNSEVSRNLQSNVVDILFNNSENLFNLTNLIHKLA